MTRLSMSLTVCMIMTCVSAQSSRYGTISGVVKDPVNDVMGNIPVQLKNVQTGKVQKASTSTIGVYNFSQLAPGMYDLLVPAVGFTLDKFEQKGIAVQVGQSVNVDVKMPSGPNLGTPGDDPSIYLRTKYAGKSGKIPRATDGKPSLAGVWLSNDDPNPEEPTMLPWAASLVKERLENAFRDGPSGFCLPGGPLLTGPLLYEIVQTPTRVITIMEDVVSVRQAFMDGRGHPKEFNPTWMGHSIAHWEGDVLVIDTVGMNDKSWLNVYPHTEQLHLVERYRRTDYSHLQVDILIEDPGTFVKPWTIHSVWNLAPGEEIGEYVCTENNRDAAHLKGN